MLAFRPRDSRYFSVCGDRFSQIDLDGILTRDAGDAHSDDLPKRLEAPKRRRFCRLRFFERDLGHD